MEAKRTCSSKYQGVVAKRLAETLSRMSLDLIRIVFDYVGCPTASADVVPTRSLTIGDRGEFSNTTCWAVACSPENHIWVSNGVRVCRFDADGCPLDYVYNWSDATGIAFDPHTGEAFVADFEAHCIRVCRADGCILRRFGSRRDGPGQFCRPAYVALDSKQGLLYVSDFSSQRVQAFKLDGSYVRVFVHCTQVNGEMLRCRGLAVNGSGELALVFDSTGKFVRQFGGWGSGPGKLSYPVGVAVDSQDNWIVSDRENSRVQVFAKNGTFLTAFGRGILNRPLGVCVDRDGRILLLEERGKVHVFDFGP